jgi:hypothetical protein
MDIDPTSIVGPPTPASTPGRAQGARGTQAGEFARVYELAEARRRRMTGPDRIPEEVWDDISRANQLADDLHAEGRAVRFETHHLTGRVVASLCDVDGNVVQPLGLREVVTGLDPEPTPAA